MSDRKGSALATAASLAGLMLYGWAGSTPYKVPATLLGATAVAATRTALKAIDTTVQTVAILTEAGRQGTFLWMAGNYSSLITADTAEGIYVKANAIASSSGAWVRVAAETFNAKWFGATGDGVTGDAAAINAAVTVAYAHTGGRNVYLPAGTYVLDAQISIPKTAGKTCRFFGDGTNATVLSIASGLSTTAGAIAIGSGTSAGGCDISVESLSVTGANTKKAFYLTNANICRFFRVECRTDAIGVQLETSYFVQFRECEFDSCATYGIVSLTTVHGLRVENSGFYAITGQGIYLAGASPSDNIVVTGNDFETTVTPIQFDPGVYSLIFTGNYVEYATGALWVFGAASYGVIIEGNWLAFSTSTSCNNLSGGRLTHNDLYDQAITAGTAGAKFAANDNQLRGTAAVTGFGGAVTQGTSRTTAVTLDKLSGAITLFSAAGSATFASFTVNNSMVLATDTVVVSQKSGTDLYEIHVTAVGTGSFRVSFRTTGGTTTEQPVFNFAVVKAIAA